MKDAFPAAVFRSFAAFFAACDCAFASALLNRAWVSMLWFFADAVSALESVDLSALDWFASKVLLNCSCLKDFFSSWAVRAYISRFNLFSSSAFLFAL